MDKPTQKLLEKVPDGLLVSRKRLMEMGFNKPSIDYFLRSKRGQKGVKSLLDSTEKKLRANGYKLI